MGKREENGLGRQGRGAVGAGESRVTCWMLLPEMLLEARVAMASWWDIQGRNLGGMETTQSAHRGM